MLAGRVIKRPTPNVNTPRNTLITIIVKLAMIELEKTLGKFLKIGIFPLKNALKAEQEPPFTK